MYLDVLISYNFMGWVMEFDYFQVGDDFDIIIWDSYLFGFLEDWVGVFDEYKCIFVCQGDLDFQVFYYDFYWFVGRGCWWVMEQQFGLVNWVFYNLVLLFGMMCLWVWEVYVYGVEVVCYFCWWQVLFVQEQMYVGMFWLDNVDVLVLVEVWQVVDELFSVLEVLVCQVLVVLIFDYDVDFVWVIQFYG